MFMSVDSAAGLTSKERQATLEKVWGFKWYVQFHMPYSRDVVEGVVTKT
jgi:hypothetical protein